MSSRLDADKTIKEFFVRMMEVMNDMGTDTVEGTLNLGEMDVDFEIQIKDIRVKREQIPGGRKPN